MFISIISQQRNKSTQGRYAYKLIDDELGENIVYGDVMDKFPFVIEDELYAVASFYEEKRYFVASNLARFIVYAHKLWGYDIEIILNSEVDSKYMEETKLEVQKLLMLG